ncbi:transposase-like protein [Bacillus thuringiensis]
MITIVFPYRNTIKRLPDALFRAKFSSTEKIQAVKRYLDGVESGKTIAKSIGVTSCVLYEWIRRYESSGGKAFEKCYTFYPAQYKLDVLYYMNEQGTSIRETAAFFNIPSYERIRVKMSRSYEKNIVLTKGQFGKLRQIF